MAIGAGGGLAVSLLVIDGEWSDVRWARWAQTTLRCALVAIELPGSTTHGEAP
jgi:hypothetical protein